MCCVLAKDAIQHRVHILRISVFEVVAGGHNLPKVRLEDVQGLPAHVLVSRHGVINNDRWQGALRDGGRMT